MRRRSRFAAVAAIIALLAGGVVAGSTLVAHADDGLFFDSGLDGSTPHVEANFTFSGTSTQAPDVSVFVDGEIGLCTAPVVAGAWSCTTTGPLQLGTHTYQAIQTLSLEPFTQIQDEITMTVLLPVPTVSAPTVVPAAGTASFVGGNGYAGATIVVAVTDPVGTGLSCSTGALPSSGAWGCDIPFDAELPPDSTVTVSVTQSLSGHADQATTYQFDVAAAPPASVTIDTPVDGFAYTWDAGTFATIDGRAPLGNSVDIDIDGAPILACTGLTVDSFGQWDCGSLNLSPGAHTITARQLTALDTATVDVEVPAPNLLGLPLVADQNDDEYTISGNYGLEGYLTHLQIDGDEVCAAWIFSGNWTCYLDLTGLALGEHTVTVWQAPFDEGVIVTSQTANHTLTVQPPGSAPTLSCSFSPGGGFTVSSPQHLDALRVYRLLESSGGSSAWYYDYGYQGYCNGNSGTPFPPDAEFEYYPLVECNGCSPSTVSLGSLPPGDYEVYHTLSDGAGGPGASYEPHSYVFTIPEAPTIANAASTTNSVILTGAATPGDVIRIVRDNGTTLCSTTATGAGTWACAFPKSSASTARAIAVDPASGGMSDYSSSRNIPIFVASAPPAAAPDVPDLPTLPTLVTWFLEFGGDLSNLKPGDRFTLNVSGMPEGTEIEVWMHSTPQLIGTATGTGAPMQMELTVPEDIESGPHEIEMVAVTPLGTNYFFTSDANVVGGTTPVDETEEDPADDGDGEGGSGGGAADRSDPGAPSALTGSIAPVAQILDNPVTIAIAGGLALALLFLVALPTELLNSSLSSNSSRLGRVYGTIDRALTRAQDWLIRFTRSRAVAAGLLVAIVAVIYGFVDPGFGFDIVSLRLVLSLGIAFFILSFVASWISGLIIRRAWGAIGVVAMQPTIILFAVIGVIVARVLDFSPGFLVGVAIGLELIQASKHVAARAVFVQLAVVTGLALAAWVVYSLFTPGNDFAGLLVEDTMVAITAEGLTGALIAVFPLRFLDGRDLWEVSKRLWVAAFLLVSTAFALLVLPTAIEGTNVADYGAWLIVFAVFGLTSLAVWLIFVRADRRAAAKERSKVDA